MSRSAEAPPAPAGASQAPHWLVTLPMMLGSGALITVQAQLNGALARGYGTGLRASALAALTSFGSGLLWLTLFALVRRSVGRGVVGLLRDVRAGRLPRWLVIGGLAGAFFVASQGIAAPLLGITFFVLCFVAGQAVAALLVDHHGWGPNGRTELEATRVLGAGLAVAAVAVSGAGLLTSGPPGGAGVLALGALPLLAGMLNSGQQGLNGRLAVRVGSWVTTWNNFLVGTLGLLVFFAVALLLPGRLVGAPSEPWLYLGGLCGIGFIWAAAVTVRVHGVLVVGVFSVAGQVVAAAVLGALTSDHPPLTTWLAAAVSIAGAVVVGLAGARRRRG